MIEAEVPISVSASLKIIQVRTTAECNGTRLKSSETARRCAPLTSARALTAPSGRDTEGACQHLFIENIVFPDDRNLSTLYDFIFSRHRSERFLMQNVLFYKGLEVKAAQ
jgi:hypothetical protein